MITVEYGGQYSTRLNQRYLNNLPTEVPMYCVPFRVFLMHGGQADRDYLTGFIREAKNSPARQAAAQSSSAIW